MEIDNQNFSFNDNNTMLQDYAAQSSRILASAFCNGNKKQNWQGQVQKFNNLEDTYQISNNSSSQNSLSNGFDQSSQNNFEESSLNSQISFSGNKYSCSKKLFWINTLSKIMIGLSCSCNKQEYSGDENIACANCLKKQDQSSFTNISRVSVSQNNCEDSNITKQANIIKEEDKNQNLQQIEDNKAKIKFLSEISYCILNFNMNDMNSQTLFCDIPFSLNNFIQEAEGKLEAQRLCSYNKFKKVVNVKTFRHGMMMDCTISSLQSCKFNLEYIVAMLNSKGNEKLHILAESIKKYSDHVETLTPKAVQISLSQDSEFLEKRIQASILMKEQILSKRDPRQIFYFKTYTIDWENFGSPRAVNYGYSKGFCEAIGLSIQENIQQILRTGFIECFSQNDRIRTMFRGYLQIPWVVRKEPVVIQTKLKFITYDNIIINNAPVSIETHNLSYEFDEANNFVNDFHETMILIQVNLNQAQESKLRQQRQIRQRRSLDDKNNDEIDFYYSKESQSFLERYYKDIYGEKYCLKKQLRRCEYIDINL